MSGSSALRAFGKNGDWLRVFEVPVPIFSERSNQGDGVSRWYCRRGWPFASMAWREQAARKLRFQITPHSLGRPRNHRIDYHPALVETAPDTLAHSALDTLAKHRSKGFENG